MTSKRQAAILTPWPPPWRPSAATWPLASGYTTGVDARLSAAIADFDFSRYGPLDTPEGAFECCIETSEGFATRCATQHGLDAAVVELTFPPVLPRALAAWQGQPRSEWIHTVVHVAGYYVDWTARQFDPATAFPALATTPFGWEGEKLDHFYDAVPALDLG